MINYVLSFCALILSVSVSFFLCVYTYVSFLFSPHSNPSRDRKKIEEEIEVGMSDSLIEYINQESEEWARNEMTSEAQRLMKIYNDWERVEVHLKKQYMMFDVNPEAAAEIAWEQSKEEVV